MTDKLPPGIEILGKILLKDAGRFGDGVWFYQGGMLRSEKFPMGFADVPDHVGPMICRIKNAYTQALEAIEEVHAAKLQQNRNFKVYRSAHNGGSVPHTHEAARVKLRVVN